MQGKFYVDKANHGCILGYETSICLGIISINTNLNEVNAINIKSNQEQYQALINRYANLFEGIGKLKKPYHIEIKPGTKSVVQPV